MRELLKNGWQFCKILKEKSELMEITASPEKYLDEIFECGENFVNVHIPHDWAIETFDSFYEDSIGCYKRELEITKIPGRKYILYFDGIYMDSIIFINGKRVCEWKYGYTPFEVDITSNVENGKNDIFVMVNYYNPNSRWYSGAGITRNVWLDDVAETYIPKYGVYANPVKSDKENEWLLSVETHVYGSYQEDYKLELSLETDEGVSIPLNKISDDEISHNEKGYLVRRKYIVSDPVVWDVESPVVYHLTANLNDECREATIIGFRQIEFKPDTGFWLNGKNIKLNGVCEHHDFGMIGGVFYEDAMERKILRLKEMGVNSIRFSHNPVDDMALELCDRLGILVLSEAFDMWARQKTDYDYARFFKQWYKKDVRSWVRKDRNHPSLIMWSIGNEIYDIHLGQEGRDIVNELSKVVRQYDPGHNAFITFCSNYMPWENAQKAADDVEVVGYNYAEKYYRQHHEEHPQWVIYGSETSSIVYSRGVYRFPYEISCMTDDDSQCSCMGNSTTSWGASSFEACAGDDRDMEFSAGQYLWTGFDYLGEPTPYHTKNSYFGQIDTAGFPKDSFYMWKSVWTDCNTKPMIYVSPDWDYNEGQMIDVRVTSNADEVELFVNDRSCGRRSLSHKAKTSWDFVATYKVPFEKGQIRAVAYDDKGIEVASMVRSSYGDTDRIVCVEEEYELNSRKYILGKYRTYGDEIKFYNIFALDKDGNPVENAADLVDVEIEGDGEFIALDNGDSTDYTPQQSRSKRLFYGKLLLVVRKTGEGPVKVNVKKDTEIIPVRRIDLTVDGDLELGPKNVETTLKVRILPEDASDRNIDFRVTDLLGNDSNVAEIIENDYEASGVIRIKAKGDGQFKVRALSKSSTDDIRVISHQILRADGLGEAFKNPYKFVAGSVYSYAVGDVTNGNERGAATARAAETVLVYQGVDFGRRGSDNMTIPIFSLDYEKINIDIYDGEWGSDECEMLCQGVYNHKQIWNVYQEDTYQLSKRLTGVHTICFRTHEKIHIKGFYCNEFNPAYEIQKAVDALKIYGDSFQLGDNLVEGIGNNVTIDFGQMDFGNNGARKISICGRANKNRNTIHLRFTTAGEEIRNIMECDVTDDIVTTSFDVSGIKGVGSVELVFLPGCNYDLDWIKFE